MNRRTKVAELPAEWKQRFKASSIKVGFQLHLSKSMLEFLCAVADDVSWDRATFGDIHYPDNWISTEGSLEKRGLIERKPDREHEEAGQHNYRELKRGVDYADCDMRNYCRLTPAGAAVVELLKVSGLFIAQDGALRRKRSA